MPLFENTQTLQAKDLRIYGRYNWKNQSERLVYVGMCEPRHGRFHQFEKVGEPGVIWCEVHHDNIYMLEETSDETQRAQQVSGPTKHVCQKDNPQAWRLISNKPIGANKKMLHRCIGCNNTSYRVPGLQA